MRPLTDEETKVFFEKLSHYIGENIKLLIDRPDGTYCFRYHLDRAYYAKLQTIPNILAAILVRQQAVVKMAQWRESIMKQACSFQRKQIVCFGTCFGRFSKSGKFKLHVTALDFLAPYAKFKVWLKSSAEQTFLYGHHIVKSGLGRITEGTEQYQGVVLLNMSDVPLGFGVAAKSTAQCRTAAPMNVVVFHQADIGQYLRDEQSLI